MTGPLTPLTLHVVLEPGTGLGESLGALLGLIFRAMEEPAGFSLQLVVRECLVLPDEEDR